MAEALIESRAAFARRRGVSPAAVTQWAQAGRIVVIGDGRVDVAASELLLEQGRGAMRGGVRRAGTAGGVQDSPGTDATPTAPPGTLLAARTALATAQAKRAETEQAARTGVLVERARYAKALEDGMGPIFAAFASFSALHGPDMAAETDVRKVQNMLDDALDGLRRDIAEAFRRMLAGPDSQQ